MPWIVAGVLTLVAVGAIIYFATRGDDEDDGLASADMTATAVASTVAESSADVPPAATDTSHIANAPVPLTDLYGPAPTTLGTVLPNDGDVASGCWTEDQRVADGGQPMQWSAPAAMTIDASRTYSAVLHTNLGDVTVQFLPEAAPETVNNFICLARSGYYQNVPFHRIVDDFVIQGGDPNGTGQGGPGYAFADEPVQGTYQVGTLAMANAGPDTNGSQFFICLPGAESLPANYNLFGRVITGFDTVAAIAAVPTSVNERGEQSVPMQPVTLDDVTVYVDGVPPTAAGASTPEAASTPIAAGTPIATPQP